MIIQYCTNFGIDELRRRRDLGQIHWRKPYRFNLTVPAGSIDVMTGVAAVSNATVFGHMPQWHGERRREIYLVLDALE